jgi:hypothetical protein
VLEDVTSVVEQCEHEKDDGARALSSLADMGSRIWSSLPKSTDSDAVAPRKTNSQWSGRSADVGITDVSTCRGKAMVATACGAEGEEICTWSARKLPIDQEGCFSLLSSQILRTTLPRPFWSVQKNLICRGAFGSDQVKAGPAEDRTNLRAANRAGAPSRPSFRQSTLSAQT